MSKFPFCGTLMGSREGGQEKTTLRTWKSPPVATHKKLYHFWGYFLHFIHLLQPSYSTGVFLASSASLAGVGLWVIFHVGFAARHPPRSWTFENFYYFFVGLDCFHLHGPLPFLCVWNLICEFISHFFRGQKINFLGGMAKQNIFTMNCQFVLHFEGKINKNKDVSSSLDQESYVYFQNVTFLY